MDKRLRRDADAIIHFSLNAVLPDEAVRRALKDFRPGKGRVLLAAAGKAAWQMAHAAVETLGRVDGGVVVTKYGHVKSEIPGVTCYEAGHPVPDENSFSATEKALELVCGLTAEDTFCISTSSTCAILLPVLFNREASMLMLPISFMINATFHFSCESRCCIKVVLPDSRYPVTSTTGTSLNDIK